MKRCEHKNTISLGCRPIEFHADEEPYQNGKREEISNEDQDTIDEIEFYVSGNYCKDCKKTFLYDGNDNLFSVQYPSDSWYIEKGEEKK